MSNKELILPILVDGKYGFIDGDYNMAIKPKYNYVSNRFKEGYCVVTYIKKIRHKLGKKGKYIETIRGIGYKFEIK